MSLARIVKVTYVPKIEEIAELDVLIWNEATFKLCVLGKSLKDSFLLWNLTHFEIFLKPQISIRVHILPLIFSFRFAISLPSLSFIISHSFVLHSELLFFVLLLCSSFLAKNTIQSIDKKCVKIAQEEKEICFEFCSCFVFSFFFLYWIYIYNICFWHSYKCRILEKIFL